MTKTRKKLEIYSCHIIFICTVTGTKANKKLPPFLPTSGLLYINEFPIPLFFKTPLFVRVVRVEKWKEVLNYRETFKFCGLAQLPNSIPALFNPLKVSRCSPGIVFSKQIYVITVYNSYIVRKENIPEFFNY